MRGECSVPIRNFIDNSSSTSIAENCANLNILWVFGFTLVISIILLVIKIGQTSLEKRNDPDRYKPLYIPLWLAFFPLLYFIWYAYTAQTSLKDTLETEKLFFAESGMKKSDFLNFRAGEDRAKLSGVIAISGALFIGSTALFGPFLRGER
jgi:hypothetical protein